MKDNEYRNARAKWAKGQAKSFLDSLERVGTITGIRITPMQYVHAYKICVEEYKFEYPSEHKLAELISTDETYEEMLAIMSEIMRRFRLAYRKTIREQRRRKRR